MPKRTAYKLPDVAFPAPRARERYLAKRKLLAICEKIKTKGWLIDPTECDRLDKQAAERVVRFTDYFERITKLGPGDNNSPLKLKEWFWTKQGAPQLIKDKRTKRAQFNAELLTTYATDYAKEEFGKAAAALYGVRKNQTLRRFIRAYKWFAREDGRIHFEFNPMGAQTGRWTSSTKRRQILEDGTRKDIGINAQQIPNKTPTFDFLQGDGEEQIVNSLRSIFIPDPGCVLLKADFEALELRLIALQDGAQKLLKWISEGADIHMKNAIHIFKDLGIPENAKKVDYPRTEMELLINLAREAAKPMAFGIAYQVIKQGKESEAKWPTLYKTFLKLFKGEISEEETYEFARNYLQLHPEIRNAQLGVVQRIDELGYEELAINGRRLYYPANNRGYNQARNFPFQATGSVLADEATIELDPRLDWQGQEIRGQTHDELIVQAPIGSAEEVKVWIEMAMTRARQIGATFAGIPATADPGFDYGHCNKVNWDILIGSAYD